LRKLTSSDLKELNLLKHYRIIRKWACKTYDLNDADLELLIYLEAVDLFTKDDFKKGTYSYSWDNRRQQALEQIIETRVDYSVERKKPHNPKISYI